jgi:hypothetical protein
MTSQLIAQKKFVVGSSRPARTPRTVLLRMARDQARADRIRALKQEHPEYTWAAIADYVGVSPRAAQSWQEKGGIAYENAKKLAELWGEDLDYIWRGPRGDTPDLMSTLAGEDLEVLLRGLRAEVARLRKQVDRLERRGQPPADEESH